MLLFFFCSAWCWPLLGTLPGKLNGFLRSAGVIVILMHWVQASMIKAACKPYFQVTRPNSPGADLSACRHDGDPASKLCHHRMPDREAETPPGVDQPPAIEPGWSDASPFASQADPEPMESTASSSSTAMREKKLPPSPATAP